jgi:hypothetical protein
MLEGPTVHIRAMVLLMALVGCSHSSGSPRPLSTPTGQADSASATAAVAMDQCDDPPTAPVGAFRHSIESPLIVQLGPHHRGIDTIASVDFDPQPIEGEVHYGLVDKALEDESVDLFGCVGHAWKALGTVITDGEGHFELDLQGDQRLPAGMRTLYLSVVGDRSGASFLALILPHAAAIAVSDVDGTLTSSENAFFDSLLTQATVGANDGAAAALSTVAQRGYPLVYMTSRGNYFTEDTRSWLNTNGFPRGPLILAPQLITLPGSPTQDYKATNLMTLMERGLTPAIGFGNRATDAMAYLQVGIPGDHIFLKQPEYATECAPIIAAGNAVGVDDYSSLEPTLEELPQQP